MELFLDPGSIVVGWAVFDGAGSGPDGSGGLKEAGLLRPPDARAHYLVRCDALAIEAALLVRQYDIDRAIVEVPSARGAAGRHGRSMGQGLTVYGFAVGAIRSAVRAQLGDPGLIEDVDADEWTKGWNKEQRRAVVAATYPQWRAAIIADKGADMVDAIALGLYWWSRRSIRARRRACIRSIT